MLGLSLGSAVVEAFTNRNGAPMVMLVMVILTSSWVTMPKTEERRPVPELLETARRMGEFFGVVVKNVQVLTDAEAWQAPNAMAMRGGCIMLTGKAYADFSARQMEFLLAHEVAHFAHFPKPFGMRGLHQFAIVFLATTALFAFAAALPIWGLAALLAASIVVTSALCIPRERRHRQMECGVDCEALRYTRDIDAAISVTEMFRGPSARWEWAHNHPIKEKRIAALRARAAQLGLTEGPAETA